MLGLRQAAEMAGVAESTIYRALKKGRISATNSDDGKLLFDPSEVTRWAASRPQSTSVDLVASEARTTAQVAPEVEIARLQAQLEAEKVRNIDLETNFTARIRGLEADRDAWRDQATRLLPAMAAQPRRSWLAALFGRAETR